MLIKDNVQLDTYFTVGINIGQTSGNLACQPSTKSWL